MEHNKMEKKNSCRSMENHKCEGTVAATAWKVVGGSILAAAAVMFIVSLPDLKRYIRISTM